MRLTAVVCRCSKKLPECDATTQFENSLDVCLRKWRTSELKSLVTELRSLRHLTDCEMNVAIEDLEARLSTIRQLAFDVRISRYMAQNPLRTFPRNFLVDGEAANLLRTC